jgi:hypothetical protein
MKTIKSSKEITTLEVGDKVIFGDLEYKVSTIYGYYLSLQNRNEDGNNNKIFKVLNISKEKFVKNLGIDTVYDGSFPEVKSLEALTAVVSALFEEYEKQNELPKTWEEFCKRNPVTPNEYWIETIQSRYCNGPFVRERDIDMDKNVCTSLQEAQAFTALIQLRQLRKAYVKNWEPDWKNYDVRKYIITFNCDNVYITAKTTGSHPMSFQTYELAEQFLNNFKDIIKIAKPLL